MKEAVFFFVFDDQHAHGDHFSIPYPSQASENRM